MVEKLKLKYFNNAKWLNPRNCQSLKLQLTFPLIFIFFFTGKLEKFEIPAAVKLCTEVWSPDMGLVTAAFKLKRKDIQERYQHEINRMYASWW